jgi:hypothetical protein
MTKLKNATQNVLLKVRDLIQVQQLYHAVNASFKIATIVNQI